MVGSGPSTQAHERRELDVAKTKGLGLEDGRACQREEEKQEAGAQAGGDAHPPGVPEEAHHEGHRHGREDHPVEDEPVLEVEEDHLHQHEDEDASYEQRRGHTEVVCATSQRRLP